MQKAASSCARSWAMCCLSRRGSSRPAVAVAPHCLMEAQAESLDPGFPSRLGRETPCHVALWRQNDLERATNAGLSVKGYDGDRRRGLVRCLGLRSPATGEAWRRETISCGPKRKPPAPLTSRLRPVHRGCMAWCGLQTSLEASGIGARWVEGSAWAAAPRSRSAQAAMELSAAARARPHLPGHRCRCHREAGRASRCPRGRVVSGACHGRR